MQLQTLTHSAEKGWSHALPSAMDSPQTPLLAFAASSYAADPAPFEEDCRVCGRIGRPLSPAPGRAPKA